MHFDIATYKKYINLIYFIFYIRSMLIKNIAKKLSAFAIVFFSFAFIANPAIVHASTVPLEDNFNHLFLKPNPNAKWWVINWGPDNGVQGRWEDYCGSKSCISIENENSNSFVRFTLQPNNPGGF